MKSNNPKDNLREKVLHFLKQKPGKSYSVKDIARALGYHPKSVERPLSDLLTEMVQNRQISRLQGRKFTFQPPRAQATGILQVTRSGIGFVRLDADTEIMVREKFLGTAFNGDTVKVALYPQKRSDRPEGEVIEVVSRAKTQFVGILEKSKSFAFVIPDDQRIHKDFYIPTKALNNAKPGDKVVIEMDDWVNPYINPEGRVTEVLGKSSHIDVQMMALIRERRLPDEFSKKTLHEAKEIPFEISKEDLAGREDIRHLDVFTIDPDDAKDFDDAVSLVDLEAGVIELGVHIADVSHYVQKESELDKEALNRSNSIYLADRVIPMLPESLSNRICSLVPNEDRLCFSVFIQISPQTEILSFRFAKTVIHSKRRFTYMEVQNILNSGAGDFSDTLIRMNQLAKRFTAQRDKKGSIDFDTPEVKFVLDTTGRPVAVKKKERLDAHRLIEEFMLLANKCVATHFTHAFRDMALSFLYRVHDEPDTGKLLSLSNFVEKLGYKLEVSSEKQNAKSLQLLMEAVKGSPVEDMVHQVALRAMAKAVYSPINIGHFGLSFKDYTHFTSPIRRYADLIVHRLLFAYVLEGKKRSIYNQDQLEAISEQCNLNERQAMEAERESNKIMMVDYMKQHIGDEFSAVITGVSQYGIYVELLETLIEGMIAVRDINDDYYRYDETEYALIGEHTGRTFRLGDPIQVICLKASATRRTIDFTIAEP